MNPTTYQIADTTDSRKLTEFLCQEGQFLLPMVELITGAEMAIDELIEVTGRAAVEAVLTLSAQEVAGPKHRAKPPARSAGMVASQRRSPWPNASCGSRSPNCDAVWRARTSSNRPTPESGKRPDV